MDLNHHRRVTDRELELAVRALVSGEPRMGLAARVVRSLEAERTERRRAWLNPMCAVAATAVLAAVAASLAVLWTPRPAALPPSPVGTPARAEEPTPIAAPSPMVQLDGQVEELAARNTRSPEVWERALPSLDRPEPIQIARIETTQIETDPLGIDLLSIPPLEVAALER